MEHQQLQFVLSAEQAKREAMLTFYRKNITTERLLITVVARHPFDGSLLFNVPANRLTNEGMLQLDISPSSVGHFAMSPEETVVDVKFDGTPCRLMFSSGLIASMLAIQGDTTVHASTFRVILAQPVLEDALASADTDTPPRRALH